MLPGHGDGDLFRHPPRTQVYCIRPSRPEDQVRILLIRSWLIQSGFSQRTFAPSASAGAYFQGDERGERSRHGWTVATSLSVVRRQLSAGVLTFKPDSGCFSWWHFSLLSGELCPSPGSALVLEDDLGLCGYALALTDAKQAAAKTQVIKCRFTGSADESLA